MIVYLISDGETYAGTVADLASSDPLIYRDKRPLRTDKLELKQLNGEYSAAQGMRVSRPAGQIEVLPALIPSLGQADVPPALFHASAR